MTPTEIFAEVEAQPPLMRQQAAAVYLGKEVCWSLKFSNATEFSQGHAHLIFRFGRESVRMVVGEILLSAYPSLIHAQAGENMLVRGRVQRIDNMTIELEIQDLVLSRTVETLR